MAVSVPEKWLAPYGYYEVQSANHWDVEAWGNFFNEKPWEGDDVWPHVVCVVC